MNDTPQNFRAHFNDKDYESLINSVIDLENKNYSDNEIRTLIKDENKDIQCWAFLKIKHIHNNDDADYVVQTLLSKDSRMRELASIIIYNHICTYTSEYKALFNKEDYYKSFIHTITDINPRVTRNITACYKHIKNKELLFEEIIYALNTYNGPFVTYWSLEGINEIIMHIKTNQILKHSEKLIKLFNRIIVRQDELLKEKVAYILINFLAHIDLTNYPTLTNNINRLKNDRNFYVKEVAKDILI